MGCIFSGCRKQRDVVKAPEEVLEVKVHDGVKEPEVKVHDGVKETEVKVSEKVLQEVFELKEVPKEVPKEVHEELENDAPENTFIPFRHDGTLEDFICEAIKTIFLNSIGHIFIEKALLNILIKLHGYEIIIREIFRNFGFDDMYYEFFKNRSSYLYIKKKLIYFECRSKWRDPLIFTNYVVILDYSNGKVIFLDDQVVLFKIEIMTEYKLIFFHNKYDHSMKFHEVNCHNDNNYSVVFVDGGGKLTFRRYDSHLVINDGKLTFCRNAKYKDLEGTWIYIYKNKLYHSNINYIIQT
uniref:Uncharacterized protein n=1 Tax=viral metagenome TaxID=1070528 RepID=A0A6C0BER7_9ZZZZ